MRCIEIINPRLLLHWPRSADTLKYDYILLKPVIFPVKLGSGVGISSQKVLFTYVSVSWLCQEIYRRIYFLSILVPMRGLFGRLSRDSRTLRSVKNCKSGD